MDEIRDQALHFLWAFMVIGAAVNLGTSWWGGAICGFILCAPREFIDQWHGWPIGWKKLMDVAFFMLGGAVVGAIS